MAILNAGKICFRGEPQALISTLKGKLWSKSIPKSELERVQKQYELLSVRLINGCYQIRLVSDISLGQGFILAEPDLEDAYFHTLKQQQR